RRGVNLPAVSPSTFYSLTLLPDGTALLNFANVIRGERNLTTVVSQVCCHWAYLVADLDGKLRQWSHVAADCDDEPVHLIPHRIRRCVDFLLHALQQLLQFR